MAMDKSDWLLSTVEEAIDPLEEIVDPHHHLWDFPTGTYLLPELHIDTGSGHNVVQTVFVECVHPPLEGVLLDFLCGKSLSIASSTGSILRTIKCIEQARSQLIASGCLNIRELKG